MSLYQKQGAVEVRFWTIRDTFSLQNTIFLLPRRLKAKTFTNEAIPMIARSETFEDLSGAIEEVINVFEARLTVIGT